jgi:hypothetical protein
LIQAQEEKKQASGPKKDRRTMKKVQKEMLTDLSVFQQVLKHPEYAKDPFKTIRFQFYQQFSWNLC